MRDKISVFEALLGLAILLPPFIATGAFLLAIIRHALHFLLP